MCGVLLTVIAGTLPIVAAPSGDEIAARVTEKLKEIQTVQTDIIAEISDGSSKNPVKMSIRVSADRKLQVTRMEITQHPVFEGQIMILDTKADQATVMPVTGQPSAVRLPAWRLNLASIWRPSISTGCQNGHNNSIELQVSPAGVSTASVLRCQTRP